MAGEGSFSITRLPPSAAGLPRRRFVFAVEVAARDRQLMDQLRDFLGHGSIYERPSRRPGWLPSSIFTIGSLRGHRRATIPFARAYLLPCAKRRQFEQWLQEMDAYEALHPNRWGKGPSPCSVEGCSRPVRGRGLCRSHYYRATGY